MLFKTIELTNIGPYEGVNTFHSIQMILKIQY